VINSKHKLIGDIKRYVKEGTKQMLQVVRNNTNKIRTLSAKVSRLEKIIKKENDK
tara:strand:- start:356 stop:520 length:165 start_codon:yes stop_codon:yes gene_type:complete